MISHKILFILVLLFGVSLAEKNLIFVQELFRHGARYPIYASDLDGSKYAVDEHSEGELTTQGKNMHYILGNKIYHTYWSELFKDTEYYSRYNQSKFLIKSTDVNRTIESCQSHLMGIFENLKPLEITSEQAEFSAPYWKGMKAYPGPVFPNAQAFHPLPIHVEKTGTNSKTSGDFLRAYSPENCPNQDKWQE